MQNKPSVLLLKSKGTDPVTDISKMAVHLENMLLETEGIDLKIRQSLTEAAIRSANFIILTGYDSYVISEFFKVLSVIEALPPEIKGPTIFLYDEPGQSIYEQINVILTRGVDCRRINHKIYDNIVDTWRYRDIIDTIAIAIKRFGVTPPAKPSAPIISGSTGDGPSTRPVED